MRTNKQLKDSEKKFWNIVAGQRIYAAFDDDEYNSVFDVFLGEDLSGKLILDIGSASGVSAALLANRGAVVCGLDISEKLVEQSNELWKDYGDKIKFQVGDAESLDFDDCSVDICFFGGVLHHIPDLTNVIAEVRRVLKPNGLFVAMEPNKLDWLELVEWKIAGLRGKLSPNEYPIDPELLSYQLSANNFYDQTYKLFRRDIPFFAQIPILKIFCSRSKGWWLKKPLLAVVDFFCLDNCKGNFFMIAAKKNG